MADLKDLKQAILEIPKLVESLKKQKLSSDKIQMAEVKIANGKTLVYESDVLQAGVPIMLLEANEKKTCPDGEYITEESTITVKYGKVINVQPLVMPASYASIKAQPAGHITPNRQQKFPDSLLELKTLNEGFEKKLAWQKEQFDKEIKALKESFNTQTSALKESAESQNKTLKEMFDLINRIANSPSLPSDFKKKDGEPVQKVKNVFEEAKALSQKVFSN